MGYCLSHSIRGSGSLQLGVAPIPFAGNPAIDVSYLVLGEKVLDLGKSVLELRVVKRLQFYCQS